MNESILITGANAGLGKETARQFALKQETRKVILFCRNRARAAAAKKENFLIMVSYFSALMRCASLSATYNTPLE